MHSYAQTSAIYVHQMTVVTLEIVYRGGLLTAKPNQAIFQFTEPLHIESLEYSSFNMPYNNIVNA